MQTGDLTQEKIHAIGELFPNCITESKNGEDTKLSIDFDALKQELSDSIIEGPRERYQFTWPGKSEAKKLANMPSNKTLRPYRSESIDFDNTQNLYIEGDNLEVLKLIRETYLNKIKVVYIDPPYNTGSDLIYDDDFMISSSDFDKIDGSHDDEGNRLVVNSPSNGRFHTDWLNMIYPRLLLSKDLLSEDGILIISIDDNELTNLVKVCDEIYGQNSRVATIPILSNPRGRQSSTFIAQTHEYVLLYAKNINSCTIKGEELTEDQRGDYKYSDTRGNYRLLGLRLRGGRATAEESPTLHFPIYYDIENDSFTLERLNDTDYEIIPKFEDGTLGTWRWSKKKILNQKDDLIVKKVKDRYDVFQKDYLTEDKRMKLKSLWYEKEINYDNSAKELAQLGLKDCFSYAKPLYLIKKLLRSCTDSDSIVLDFFSGSGTTAQAVMELNKEDRGCRQFILVQIPETCDETSSDKQKYTTICEIGKERIRRVSDKINESTGQMKIEACYSTYKVDAGFRLFKVDSSNELDTYYTPSDTSKKLFDALVDNIKGDRAGEDLLIQVMLEYGIELSSSIETQKTDNSELFVVDKGYLIACFDRNIPENIVNMMAQIQPEYAVFRDSTLSSDSMACNIEQIFKTFSPSTKIRVL